MASITVSSAMFTVASGSSLVQRRSTGTSSPILGLPSMGTKGGVKCSAEKKSDAQESGMAIGASLLAAVSAATISSPAMAVVDDRMGTEGVGLSLGLSDNILGWILVGVFGTIWALYYDYVSKLEEDEESGLSL